MLRKKMWIPSTLEREKEKRGIFALHDSEVFEEKREKNKKRKVDRLIYFSVHSFGTLELGRERKC